mgnify:CR=1 FL=1
MLIKRNGFRGVLCDPDAGLIQGGEVVATFHVATVAGLLKERSGFGGVPGNAGASAIQKAKAVTTLHVASVTSLLKERRGFGGVLGNTGAAYQQIEEAKAVCRTCKVIDACLKCALDTNQDYGVWGGLSEDERRALKRRNARTKARSGV